MRIGRMDVFNTSARSDDDDDDDEKKKDESGSSSSGGSSRSGGGVFGNAWNTLAGAADHAAGSTDEAIGRQFDDEKGGGVGDGLASAAGIKAFEQSEQGADLRETYQETAGDTTLGGHAKRFDTSVRAGMDFLLDNPTASVQDTVRGGLELATGEDKESFAKGLQSSATDFRETTNSLTDDTFLNDTAVEGATDALAGVGDMFVADPAKAAVTGLTGVDVDKGTSEGTIGAAEVADVGLTVATGGAGKAGLSLLKNSDEAASVTAKLLGGTDEGASVLDESSTLSRFLGGSDEAAGASDEIASVTDDVAGATDEAAGASDNLPVLYDEAGSLGDDVAGLGDEVAAGSDEAGGLLSRIRSRVAGASDEAAGASDEIAGASDDVAAGADEAGGLLSRIGANSGTAKLAGLGLGGVAVGGALTGVDDAPDRIETAEGDVMTVQKRYSATERFPNGGKLYKVTRDGESAGYWVLLGLDGRNLKVLDSDGSVRNAKISVEQFKSLVSADGEGGAAA